MAKEVIGHVTCPHCGGDATVHRNARSARLLYYRCGEVWQGHSTGCGTVQIAGRTGQEWIERNMRPVDAPAPTPKPATRPDPVPDPVPQPAPDPVPDPVPQPASDPKPQPITDPVPKPRPAAPRPHKPAAGKSLWDRLIDGATGDL